MSHFHFAWNRFAWNRFGIEYDTDYGMDKRSGWTFWWNGSVVVEFEPLVRALWVGWRRAREYDSWSD